MKKRYWRISGYDSTTLIFDMKVTIGCFTEDQIQRLLRALAAKEGLNHSEIVGAYAKRGSQISNDHLSVHKEFGRPIYMCGSNPYFVASVVDENGKVVGSA